MRTLKKTVQATIAAVLATSIFTAAINNVAATSRTPVMGYPKASSEDLAKYVLSVNQKPELNVSVQKLASLYVNIGKQEGVRGDIAFVQAIKETGYFKFGGDVLPKQNNFAGIGAVGSGAKGTYFSTPEAGVRAQIQHLKAYASIRPLVLQKTDPRFDLVRRGIAQNWEDLNGKWAVPGVGYGEDIINIYNKIPKQNNYIKGYPTATLVIRKNVSALTTKKKYASTLKANTRYSIYKKVENYYDIGGGKLVKIDYNKMNVLVGNLTTTAKVKIFKSNGKSYTSAPKGKVYAIYGSKDNYYYIGSGNYIKKADKIKRSLGTLTVVNNTTLFDEKTKNFTTLYKGKKLNIYTYKSGKLYVDANHYIYHDKNVDFRP